MAAGAHSTEGGLLKLYVTGSSPRADAAVASLHRVCARCGTPHFEVVVIDVLQHPDLAEAARVLATPTLVRERPLPVRRVVGDLSDVDQVMEALDISPGA